MKIYLASRYSRRDELCGYRQQLIDLGHVVTSRWLAGDHQTPDHCTTEHQADCARRFAIEDMEDLLVANVLIAFTEEPRSSTTRGGRHVEFGIALGAQIPVFFIGPYENVFCHLPQVRWAPSFAALLDARPIVCIGQDDLRCLS